jgi:hypothetical protein
MRKNVSRKVWLDLSSPRVHRLNSDPGVKNFDPENQHLVGKKIFLARFIADNIPTVHHYSPSNEVA